MLQFDFFPSRVVLFALMCLITIAREIFASFASSSFVSPVKSKQPRADSLCFHSFQVEHFDQASLYWCVCPAQSFLVRARPANARRATQF